MPEDKLRDLPILVLVDATSKVASFHVVGDHVTKLIGADKEELGAALTALCGCMSATELGLISGIYEPVVKACGEEGLGQTFSALLEKVADLDCSRLGMERQTVHLLAQLAKTPGISNKHLAGCSTTQELLEKITILRVTHNNFLNRGHGGARTPRGRAAEHSPSSIVGFPEPQSFGALLAHLSQENTAALQASAPAARVTANSVLRVEKLMGQRNSIPPDVTPAERSEIVAVLKGANSVIADSFSAKAMEVARVHFDAIDPRGLNKLLTMELPEGKKPWLVAMAKLLGQDPDHLPSTFLYLWGAFAADMVSELGARQFDLPDIPALLRAVFQGRVDAKTRELHSQEIVAEVLVPQVQETMGLFRTALGAKKEFTPPVGLVAAAQFGAAAFVSHRSASAMTYRDKEQKSFLDSISSLESQLVELKRLQSGKRGRGEDDWTPIDSRRGGERGQWGGGGGGWLGPPPPPPAASQGGEGNVPQARGGGQSAGSGPYGPGGDSGGGGGKSPRGEKCRDFMRGLCLRGSSCIFKHSVD